MQKSKILGIMGGVVGLGVYLGLKFLTPSAEVAIKNSVGEGWSEAKGELTTGILETLRTEYAPFALPEPLLQKMAGCVADKSIAYLNTTDCSYLYNTATTSEAEHLAAQELCLKKVDFEGKQAGYTLECTRADFPDDWQVMRGLLAGEFEKSLVEESTPAEAAKLAGGCMADKLVVLLAGRKCPLVNRNAAKPEEMLNGFDACVKDPANDPEFQAIQAACLPAKPEAAKP